LSAFAFNEYKDDGNILAATSDEIWENGRACMWEKLLGKVYWCHKPSTTTL
jgi:hypothetical protein